MENLDNDCPRFRPFLLSNQRLIKVKKAKYSTSLDPRGYIPVYEYVINGQPIMWDRETGYVHFTGIWKALGNSKSDIVKMVDSNPELKVKKIRGGFLKIQGTWIPYSYAYILCKRTAWNIRKELLPLLGPRFINDVIEPSHLEYGCLLLEPKNSNVYQKGVRQLHHPYKRDFIRKSSSLPKKISNNMSLSRLLNVSDHQKDEKLSKVFIESPNSTPSPTLHVIPNFPLISSSSNWHLSSIFNDNAHLITPIYCTPSNSTSPNTMSILPCNTTIDGSAKDIIDTINATILLQRLSQDDGVRPFKPMHPEYIPTKVIVGNQEFKICWD